MSRSKILLAAAAAAGLLMAAPAGQAADLFTNASFEAGSFVDNGPVFGDHTMQLPYNSTAISDWLVTGDGTDASWIEPGNPYDVTASAGRRSLDLTGYTDASVERATLRQYVNLGPGDYVV